MVDVMRTAIGYWASSEVPPVDPSGRLRRTSSVGRRGARFPQLVGGESMVRPAEAAIRREAMARESLVKRLM